MGELKLPEATGQRDSPGLLVGNRLFRRSPIMQRLRLTAVL